MKKNYGKRSGSRIRGDPSVIGRELERLRRKHDGVLTADIVVEAAKKPSSPLHGEFEWNRTKAAHNYWLRQARTIMADITIECSESKTIRALTHIIFDDGKGYVGTEDALSDPDMRKQVIQRLQDEAEDWSERAELYREFAKVIAEIRKRKKR